MRYASRHFTYLLTYLLYELQIFSRRTALTLVQLTTKSVGKNQQRVYHTKVQDVDDSKQRQIDVWAGGNRSLLIMALTSGASLSMSAFEPQKDILNIHC